MSFGERLRSARIALGMSQEELGLRLDITQSAIAKWEIAGSFPDTLKLVPITKILGVTLDWLLEADDSPFPNQLDHRKNVRAMSLVKTLTATLDDELLSESQITLLSDMVNEFRLLNKSLSS